MLATASSAALPVEEYAIEEFRPEDAAAISSGFRTVYGNHYVSGAVYDPAYFVKSNAQGDMHSVVVRASDGTVAAHLALVPSAPYPGLMEVAQGIVLPEHRRAGLLSTMVSHMIGVAARRPDCCGLFGTALANHTISQRALIRSGFRDIGFEVDYVPERLFAKEAAVDGPMSIVFQYRVIRAAADLAAYLPAPYAGTLANLYNRLGETRQYKTPRGRMPWTKLSRTTTVDLPRFDMTRLLVRKAAIDLEEKVAELEREARATDRRVLQVVLNLGEPACGPAVSLLRRQGFWLGGLLPRWFDSDGLLMQKSLDVPNFPSIRAYSQDAQTLLQTIMADAKDVGTAVPAAA